MLSFDYDIGCAVLIATFCNCRIADNRDDFEISDKPQIVALINEHAQSDIGSVKTKARKVQKNLPNATDKPTKKKPGKGREEGVTR